MPRRSSSSRLVDWKVTIPVALAKQVEEILMDDTTQRPQYGGRSQLVEYLLRDFLISKGITSLASALDVRVVFSRPKEPSHA